jgi:putative ABC transport system substrate-binding protein
VESGLVSSINRPGGNVTGVSFYDIPIIGKRLDLLHQLVPKAEVIAVLQDSNFSVLHEETREIEAAARAIGQKLIMFKAGREEEIDAAFSMIAKSGAGALLVGGGPFVASRPLQPIRKDLVIRFRRQRLGEGGNHGCEGDFGKEVCCEAERRGA